MWAENGANHVLDWIYELPSWTVAFLFAATFIGVNWLGALFVRPVLKILIGKRQGSNDVIGYVLSFVSVIYGVLLGMLAIVTYQNLAQADEVSTHEAATLAAIYRNVSSYPDPVRKQLGKLLGEHTKYVLAEEWQMQRMGLLSTQSPKLTEFQRLLMSFEPQSTGQQIMHEAAVQEFNKLVDYRRMRLHLAETRIPAIMWYTVVIGAVLCMVFIWLFDTSLMAQLILGGLAAFGMSSMICLSALMDNPFRGELGVSPAAFQAVYDSLMKS
jgi:hypothetical protein